MHKGIEYKHSEIFNQSSFYSFQEHLILHFDAQNENSDYVRIFLNTVAFSKGKNIFKDNFRRVEARRKNGFLFALLTVTSALRVSVKRKGYFEYHGIRLS
ncbi:hypothetical protein CEXT_696141 [Caerostris extrusa]|uniref:Uncharacterized protein n=1 Tax=Caerostris extrusa TaxID=172846 RepID=A0AAV4WI82_CAEEX|nr:hypothetical protein CEXT_696141 [Caerostris extrusa]